MKLSLLALAVCGLTASGLTASDPSRAIPAQAAQAQLIPPVSRSPVGLFRELLAMSPVERRVFLTNRPPETQKLILAKIREYESMRADVRELRLRATELRWHLLPLMRVPPAQRAGRLEQVDPETRKLVDARLRLWDLLPPPLQKELLENEAAVHYFSELNSATDDQQQRMLQEMSPARRQKLEEGIAQWRRLPEDERRAIAIRFQQFFDLTPDEKTRALATLSEPEREQIEKTLRRFGSLPPHQRAQCLRSFEKFASLPLEERQQFLKNAERWKLMSPTERQAWRDLVNKLANQPPLPPGADGFPMPPMPPIRRPAVRTSNVSSTN